MAEETLNQATATAADTSGAATEPAETAATATPPAESASILSTAAAETQARGASPEQAGSPEPAPKEAAAQDEGAPEAYADFEGGDGKAIPAASLGGFTKVAKELGLSQAKAQKLVSALRPTVDGYINQSAEKYGREWAEQVKADKELGGADFDKKLAVAVSAYKNFSTPELQKMLEATRLGNHPEVIRMFYRIGTAMSQDTGVAGSGAPVAKRRIYPNSNMNY